MPLKRIVSLPRELTPVDVWNVTYPEGGIQDSFLDAITQHLPYIDLDVTVNQYEARIRVHPDWEQGGIKPSKEKAGLYTAHGATGRFLNDHGKECGVRLTVDLSFFLSEDAPIGMPIGYVRMWPKRNSPHHSRNKVA